MVHEKGGQAGKKEGYSVDTVCRPDCQQLPIFQLAKLPAKS
jgi:hypothetical protein